VTAGGVLALFGIGVAGGLVSTVASIASVVSYPALLAFGLPPLTANMTNTFALMFTGAGAAVGSRPELTGQGGPIARLAPVAALGGGAGAALLLVTPASAFQRVAPVLIGAASLVLLAPPVRARAPAETSRGRRWLLLCAFFAATAYVGYFGAAGGILLLAVLTAMLAEPLARGNALKNVASGFANGVAAIAFAALGRVDWAVVPPLAAGFLAGGWAGPALVRRLPGRAMRVLVGCCGLAVAVRLALAAYR
jgi:uncharacterized membrane protein YfcA